MALTRANVEVILIKRVGALMTQAGLDGTTVDGTNVDLNDPIGYSIRQLDGTVADVTNVADSDLAGIGADDYDQLFDVAELRLLQNILQNLVLTDIEVGPRKQWFDQLAKRLEKMVDFKRKLVDDKYALVVPVLSTGVLNLNFAEHDENYIDELGN